MAATKKKTAKVKTTTPKKGGLTAAERLAKKALDTDDSNKELYKGVEYKDRSAEERKAAAILIHNGSICYHVVFHKPGEKRKGDMELVETEADKDLLELDKKIFDIDEYDVIRRYDREVRQFLVELAFPGVFKRSIFQLAVGLVSTIEKRMEQEFKPNRQRLVDAFLEKWPDAVEDAERRLKNQFNDANYPTTGEMARRFWVETKWFSPADPQQLDTIAGDVLAKEMEASRTKYSNLYDEIEYYLRETFYEIVKGMHHSLTPDEDGRKGIITPKKVERFLTFIDTFDARNITNDDELSKLVSSAKSLLSGKRHLSVDYLMSEIKDGHMDSGFKNKVEAGLANIHASLQAMVVVQEPQARKRAGSRKISFQE